jgi:aryl-alcohol dehydrogenase
VPKLKDLSTRKGNEMKIRAAVAKEIGKPYSIEEVDLAEPKEGELLIRMVGSGICHTDEAAQHQFLPVPLPAVLGHEGSGIVEIVGAGVKGFKPGDHVAVSFGSCGHCNSCLDGAPYLCEGFNEINFGGVMPDGSKRLSQNGEELSSFFGQSSFATHAVVSAGSAVLVPDDIDLALVGPLGCGIQTGAGTVLNILRPGFDSTIAVLGVGTVGMSAIMAAKLAGCKRIIAVGGNPTSLELARELGATDTVNRKKVDDIVAAIREIGGGKGVDYAIDTTGVGDFVRKALASVKTGGTAVVLGATGDLTINVQDELMGESKSLIGIVEGNSNPRVFLPKLLEAYRAGRFPFDRIMRFYDFEDINQAAQDSSEGKVIKAVLRF